MPSLLDDDLAAAAPPVRERTPQLQAALRELVVDTEQWAGREELRTSHRRRRIAAVGLAATAVLTTGGTAAAGWLPSPWWQDQGAVVQRSTSPSGAECSVTYAARPISDPAHPVGAEERAAALSAAEEFLRSFDAAGVIDQDPDTVAVILDRRLNDALRQQGLSIHAVSVALMSDCENENGR